LPLPAGADTTLTRADPSRPDSRGRDTTPPAPEPATSLAVTAGSTADATCPTRDFVAAVVIRLGAQTGQPLGFLAVAVGEQDRTEPVLDWLGRGDRVEDQPRAACRIGGIDGQVPGDRARADRATEGLPPEVR
jgi:hypothetical protein